MPYQRKKRKVRRHRQPDRIAMAKRKRERKKFTHSLDTEMKRVAALLGRAWKY